MIFEWSNTLEERYNQCCTKRGDIHEHLPTLVKYGQMVDTITEMGVRTGGSTSAWLTAKPKKLTCYDIILLDTFHLSQYDKWANEQDIDFEFVIADTRKIVIEPTELLFIDTLHTYEQLKKELEIHPDKVSRFIIFHDTVSFARRGMNDCKKGLMPAIEEFLISHPEWKEREHFKNCNGLLIIERHGIQL